MDVHAYGCDCLGHGGWNFWIGAIFQNVKYPGFFSQLQQTVEVAKMDGARKKWHSEEEIEHDVSRKKTVSDPYIVPHFKQLNCVCIIF